ncbi:MAG TPA: DUF29 domain-containing protein [Aurantimonas coralicida]|uniref:DUF29 domain-containing protein n=2 Tax=root TaxID=1 RepID=A0A9C9NIA9_9HYPH|nr:DUF29 domain-containing protein [Aurantimonas coralicida]HEU01870.1 DUF29 domain-containing protein [Aurantimonas coralicida]
MAEPAPTPNTDLYERDFYAWTQDQAAKLRARASFDNRGDVDWDHAAEEIEGVGASEKREIRSRLKTLLVHLLKWRFQPGKRKGGWEATIGEQRERIAMVIEDSPSLRSFPGEALASAYVLARRKAIEETELPEEAFPLACPFTIDQILDETFYPETD